MRELKANRATAETLAELAGSARRGRARGVPRSGSIPRAPSLIQARPFAGTTVHDLQQAANTPMVQKRQPPAPAARPGQVVNTSRRDERRGKTLTLSQHTNPVTL